MEYPSGQQNTEPDLATVENPSIDSLDPVGLETLRKLASQQDSRYQNSGDVFRPWHTDDSGNFPAGATTGGSNPPTTPTLRANSIDTGNSESPYIQPTIPSGGTPVYDLNTISSVLPGVHVRQLSDTDLPDDLLTQSTSSVSSGLSNESATLTCTVIQNPDLQEGEPAEDETYGRGRSEISDPSTTSDGGTFLYPFLELVVRTEDQKFKVFRALRDTGAKINVIAERVLRRLGILQRQKCARDVTTVDGREVVLKEYVKIRFSINDFGDRTKKARFHVIEDRCMPGNMDSILCENFIQKHDLFQDPLQKNIESESTL